MKLMVLCQMTIAGAPNIYYGDEIGLPGGHDPDCRRAFPWHDEASWNQDLLAWYQQCIQLRRDIPALRRGDFQIIYADKTLVVYQRHHAGQTAVVALNMADQEQNLICPVLPAVAKAAGALPERMVSSGKPLVGGQTYKLPGRSARVWSN